MKNSSNFLHTEFYDLRMLLQYYFVVASLDIIFNRYIKVSLLTASRSNYMYDTSPGYTYNQHHGGQQITESILVLSIDWLLKGTDQAGTFMSLKCVVYYANYRSWHQSSKIQVVS